MSTRHTLSKIYCRYISLAILLFSSVSSIAQIWVPIGDLPQASRYDDVYFINRDTGWTGNAKGEIYKTTDGGNTWLEVYSSDYYIRSIEFIDGQTGFAGTLDSVLLRTTDGGAHWTEIQDLIPGLVKGICGMSHIGNTLYGVGWYFDSAHLIKSTDGGSSWTFKDMSEYADGLVDVWFLDEKKGYVGGIHDSLGGVVLRTTDGGNQWDAVYATEIPSEYVWKLDFVNNTIGYASIEGIGTRILKTVNGGISWDSIHIAATNSDLQGIGFMDEEKGWIGPRYQTLYETNDGGGSWELINQYIPNINKIFRLDSQRIYASGSTVYQYKDDTTEITYPRVEQPHEIVNAFPNPFDNHLSVSVRIDQRTLARLDLIALHGGESVLIYKGRLASGLHEFQLDGTPLMRMSNGQYILLLRTNEAIHSERINMQFE